MIQAFKTILIFMLAVTAMLCLSPRCFSQAAPTAQTSTTGSITGRVVNSAGDPLAGAAVYANALGNARRSNTTKVNDNGEFKIDGLGAGVYRVWASLPGYVPSIQTSSVSPNLYHIGDSVNISLSKGGVITGKVAGSNGPMIAVGVFAIRVRDEEGKRLPTPIITRERATDDRGIYRLYGLSPGTYLVMAARPRIGMIAPSAYDTDTPTYFPSSPRDTASEIIVREGEETTADILYRSEPGHAISGQVTGVSESQTPYSTNVTVILTDVRDRASMFGLGTGSYDNFNFAVTGVPDGEYELSALQYTPTLGELRSPPRRVTVRGADVAGITLALAKQGEIEGRLVFETDAKAECGKRRDTAAQ